MSEEYRENNHVVKKHMENVEEEFNDYSPAIDPTLFDQGLADSNVELKIFNAYEFIGSNNQTKSIRSVNFQPFVVEGHIKAGYTLNKPVHYKPAIELPTGMVVGLTNLKIIGSDDFFFHTNDELYLNQKRDNHYGKGIVTVHITGEYDGITYIDFVEIDLIYVDTESIDYTQEIQESTIDSVPFDTSLAMMGSSYFNDGLKFVQKISKLISPIATEQAANSLVLIRGIGSILSIEQKSEEQEDDSALVMNAIIGPQEPTFYEFQLVGIVYMDGKWKKFTSLKIWRDDGSSGSV